MSTPQRKDNRNRPRHDQLGRRGPGSWPSGSDTERRRSDCRREDVPFRGRVHHGRHPAGRGTGEEAGRRQSRGHRLRESRGRWARTTPSASRGRSSTPQQIELVHPPEDQEGRRDLPRLSGQEGGHNGPRPLQRQPEAGDQGRRRDSGPRSCPDNQRADGRLPRLRTGQDREGDEGPGLQLRRWDPRRHRDGVRRGGLPGPRDQRRHADRRGRHRLRHSQAPARRLQGEDGHRPEQGHGPPWRGSRRPQRGRRSSSRTS